MQAIKTLVCDWTDDGYPGTLCPESGLCSPGRGQYLGCPYYGLAGKANEAATIDTCPGWYRKQPLWSEMLRADRLRAFWSSSTPDNLSSVLCDFYYWHDSITASHTVERARRDRDNANRTTKT